MPFRSEEIQIIRNAWIERGFDSEFVDYYLEKRLAESKVFSLQEEKGFKGLYFVDTKVLNLHDKNIKTAYIHPVINHNELFEEVLEWASRSHIVSLVPEVSEWYQDYGFEMVVSSSIYNIGSVDLPEFPVKGIVLDPLVEDCLKVYDRFIHHFSGSFLRNKEDFMHKKALIKRRGGSVIGYEVDGKLVGYVAYIRGNNFVDVLELCYNKSSTLMQMLSFITKGVSRARIHVSPSEHLNRVLPNLKATNTPLMSARINDKELFERLYRIKIISAYSGFNAFGKPIWNRDLM